MVLDLPPEEFRRRFGFPTPCKTGACANGWHEGTRPISWRGVPLPVCIRWESCPCECHIPINEMYEMAGVPREPHQNPDYVPEKSPYVMPIFGIDYGLDRDATASAGGNRPTGLKQRVNGAPGARTFEPTPSGRAARGQLEDRVLECITEWLLDPGNELCTVKFIAWDIARFHNIPEPSTGAIAAVLDRWVSYNYCLIEFKPTRFVSLTDEGKENGLDHMRALYKRSRK